MIFMVFIFGCFIVRRFYSALYVSVIINIQTVNTCYFSTNNSFTKIVYFVCDTVGKLSSMKISIRFKFFTIKTTRWQFSLCLSKESSNVSSPPCGHVNKMGKGRLISLLVPPNVFTLSFFFKIPSLKYTCVVISILELHN